MVIPLFKSPVLVLLNATVTTYTEENGDELLVNKGQSHLMPFR
jgi:hypothetical protein